MRTALGQLSPETIDKIDPGLLRPFPRLES